MIFECINGSLSPLTLVLDVLREDGVSAFSFVSVRPAHCFRVLPGLWKSRASTCAFGEEGGVLFQAEKGGGKDGKTASLTKLFPALVPRYFFDKA